MKRVVITGMAGISALGSDWATIQQAFQAGRSAIRVMPDWSRYTEPVSYTHLTLPTKRIV